MVVLGMLKWKCPPLLILVVLLTRWNDQIKHSVDPITGFKGTIFVWVIECSCAPGIFMNINKRKIHVVSRQDLVTP